MDKLKTVLAWAGVIVLGLANGLLEDIVYLRLLVEYVPPSVGLTGDLFWLFTVPLSQLIALSVTGTFAWFLGVRHHMARLIAFWLCWTVSRAAFLTAFNNPPGDIAIYLVWVAFWCGLIGLAAFVLKTRSAVQDDTAD